MQHTILLQCGGGHSAVVAVRPTKRRALLLAASRRQRRGELVQALLDEVRQMCGP